MIVLYFLKDCHRLAKKNIDRFFSFNCLLSFSFHCLLSSAKFSSENEYFISVTTCSLVFFSLLVSISLSEVWTFHRMNNEIQLAWQNSNKYFNRMDTRCSRVPVIFGFEWKLNGAQRYFALHWKLVFHFSKMYAR